MIACILLSCVLLYKQVIRLPVEDLGNLRSFSLIIPFTLDTMAGKKRDSGDKRQVQDNIHSLRNKRWQVGGCGKIDK